ncbi:M48 family metalloprotease [Arthrobacter sp. Soc17.1.1.1]|uniref:M48 family metalloprotease n=1 Tax=Arthrobacter sp. Soc17.1.1.1 TaxID=3121277 RepID=UPI002FE4C2F4
MTTPHDRRAGDDLLQEARAIVERAAEQAGLPTPAVTFAAPIDKPGAPRANAEYKVIRGVPMIKVTEAALRELPSDLLRFLLLHEVGHFADEAWWKRNTRQFLAGMGFAVLLALGGVVVGPIGENFGAGYAPGLAIFAVSLIVAGALGLIYLANSRTNELRADRFAGRQHGNLLSARDLFEVWDREAPERVWGRGLLLLVRSHPYRATRLEAIEAELNRQDPPATRRT